MLTDEQLRKAIQYNKENAASIELDQSDYALAWGAAQVQKEDGLDVDGKIGPLTRSAIDARLEEPVVKGPFRGLPVGRGVFIRAQSHIGTPSEFKQALKANDMNWVVFQRIWQYEGTKKSLLSFRNDTLLPYVDVCTELDVGVWFWGYPQPDKLAEFSDDLAAAAMVYGYGVIADPEKPFYGKPDKANLLTELLMTEAVRWMYRVGVTSYGAPWYHSNFPFQEFSSAHFGMPQVYDMDNNMPDDYGERAVSAYLDAGFPSVIPVFPGWNKTTAQLRKLMGNTPTPSGACCSWDWYNLKLNKSLMDEYQAFDPASCR